MRVLIVEDEIKTAQAVARVLREEGFAVDAAADGEEGLYLAKSNPYDVIILDVTLPRLDGMTVCRRYRDGGGTSPVIMLTANTLTPQKVAGLDAGADDYLAKPFEFDELLARLRALVRRREAVRTPTLRVGDIELDRAGRIVRRGGRLIELSPKEFAVFEFLLRHADVAVTRTDILEGCWDMNFESDSNTIDVHIASIRRKTESNRQPRIIKTVRSVGYIIRNAR